MVTGFRLEREGDDDHTLIYRHDDALRAQLTPEQGSGSCALFLVAVDLDGIAGIDLVSVDTDGSLYGRFHDTEVLDRTIAALAAAREALTA